MRSSFRIAVGLVLSCVLSVCTSGLAGDSAGPFAAATIPNAGYHVVHGWPVLPENSVLNEVSAVAVDSKGDVLVLQRGGRQWPDSDVLERHPSLFPLYSFSTDETDACSRSGVKNSSLYRDYKCPARSACHIISGRRVARRAERFRGRKPESIR